MLIVNKIQNSYAAVVYSASYFFTSVLGAIIIGLSEGNILYLKFPSMDTNLVHDYINDEYWLYIFMPFIVISILLIILKKIVFPWENLFRTIFICEKKKYSNYNVLLFITLIFAALCFTMMPDGGVSRLISFLHRDFDYTDIIINRKEFSNHLMSFGRLNLYYEIVYVGLPVMVWISIYKIYSSFSLKLLYILIFQSLLTVFLQVATFQKAPTIIFLFGIILSFHVLSKKINFIRYVVCIIIIFVILHFLQNIYQSGNFNYIDTIIHAFLRTPSSIPFYLTVYDNYETYQMSNFGVGLFFGVTQLDSQIVFNYAYPDVLYVQGGVAAPSHIRAISFGGMGWSLFALFITFFFIRFIDYLYKFISGPLGFSFIIQSFITLFFLTQVSLRGAFLESYGLKFCIITLISIILLSVIIRGIR